MLGLILVSIALSTTPPAPQQHPLPAEIVTYITEEALDNNISPQLVLAIIEHESNYTERAVSKNGLDKGYMQIRQKCHRERMKRLDVTNLLSGKQNIKVGIDILAELFAQNDDVEWVLMAYNGGVGYANRIYGKGIVSDYAKQIIARADELDGGEADGLQQCDDSENYQ